jgi:hypothetical protein
MIAPVGVTALGGRVAPVLAAVEEVGVGAGAKLPASKPQIRASTPRDLTSITATSAMTACWWNQK